MTISDPNDPRKNEFKRNDRLEILLRDLNGQLGIAEPAALDRYADYPDYPVIFVMGPLRSGTTLFMQWLAHTGLVAYPSNLLSRFYGAPVIGAQIQLLLTDPRFNFRNEILDFNSAIGFDSENGKTSGALAPNEFWYFWRRFLPFRELDWLPDDELMDTADHAGLVAELTALTRAFGRPFALKGMIMNYNIAFLRKIFTKAIFIQIVRDPIANIASVLAARQRQSGDESTWYSFKIPEYPALKELEPLQQAAGQVFFINRAVSEGMAAIDDSAKLIVRYEEFCRSPETVHHRLMAVLAPYGVVSDQPYRLPEQFACNNITPDEDRIARAYRRFAG